MIDSRSEAGGFGVKRMKKRLASIAGSHLLLWCCQHFRFVMRPTFLIQLWVGTLFAFLRLIFFRWEGSIGRWWVFAVSIKKIEVCWINAKITYLGHMVDVSHRLLVVGMHADRRRSCCLLLGRLVWIIVVVWVPSELTSLRFCSFDRWYFQIFWIGVATCWAIILAVSSCWLTFALGHNNSFGNSRHLVCFSTFSGIPQLLAVNRFHLINGWRNNVLDFAKGSSSLMFRFDITWVVFV